MCLKFILIKNYTTNARILGAYYVHKNYYWSIRLTGTWSVFRQLAENDLIYSQDWQHAE